MGKTLNQNPMTILQYKLLTTTYCEEARDYDVPNVLSPRDYVFRYDISDINWTINNLSYEQCKYETEDIEMVV